ncbi:hypothetical protein JTE90_003789 [Oedothorax gibbosus]|uniref:Uncharacterized protein n=1 Tax=Oedothorax gibbosus TaxID=931172 RepID=A0AAV6VBP9_9ARAC|nr:hypothetical protein JTE90_003789 [Oedothorax gibbosus]
MNEPQPGPSNVQIPLIKHDQATSEDDSGSIKYVDSPDTPPAADTGNFRKASISAAAQQQLHDGIILLITSDSESQRSPNGSIAQHPLSEYYLLPLPQDASGANRRYSLQERNKQYHPERKASCPDAELGLSPDRTPHRRSSELDITKDRLTPTSFSSRRSSNASACHSRRSSNCSLHHHHHHRRPSNCSRRSSNSSRRSSTASHKSSNCSRRSSNCSRRSSHVDSDEDNSFLHQHSHHHSHHHSHRGSRCSLDPIPHREEVRRGSHYRTKDEEELDEEREELEMGGIPPRHRKIIIWIIGSVSIFILLMSVVLIAVSLTMSPTIDDLGESFFVFLLILNRSDIVN